MKFGGHVHEMSDVNVPKFIFRARRRLTVNRGFSYLSPVSVLDGLCFSGKFLLV